MMNTTVNYNNIDVHMQQYKANSSLNTMLTHTRDSNNVLGYFNKK